MRFADFYKLVTLCYR